MPVKLKPTSQIKARLGIQPNGRVQKFFTNECVKAMDKYIPMREGNLRLIKDERSDSVTYESPYAKYQYYGKLMVGKAPKTLTNKDLQYHSGDSKRGSFWFERSKADNLDAWLNGVAQVIGGHR